MLDTLKEKVCQCTKCPDLNEIRTNYVFGEGNQNSSVIFIGESPGSKENETGRPFVGKAGELLDELFKNCNIKREEVYILNTIKCHPENNRNPYPTEIENCRPYLNLQLKIINPKIIVCLGLIAAKNLLKTDEPLNKLRNKWFEYNQAKVLVTYHPSFILRSPSFRPKIESDFTKIFNMI